MEKLTLVKTNYNHHVSMDLYHEFESCVVGRNNWDITDGIGSTTARIMRQILKVIPPIPIPIRKNKNYVVFGYQKEKFFPYFHYKANRKILWMYDAWEPLFDEIEKTVRQYGINLLLTASKQSADYFNSLGIANFKSVWVPEAVDASQYKFTPYENRTTDVLQLGRKWPWYHEKIKEIESAHSYKYELKTGQIIFKTREEFLNGLSNSKISICVPSDITHPERSGAISTITNRYLQSMASKCLILGKMPYDMQFQFDYNPIVEIDESDPVGQIKAILANYDSYIPLIEKNYRTVTTQHNWNNRIDQIASIVNEIKI